MDAFHVFQAHHDYCPHHALDDVDDAETLIHYFEEIFEMCEIGRIYDPDLESCPEVDCTDFDHMLSVVDAILSEECTSSCESESCSTAFQMILSYHDYCEPTDVPFELEEALHDFEELCEESLCNTVGPDYDITATLCDI